MSLPRTTAIGPQFFGDLFLVVTLQNYNRHTSARAQKNFPTRNMRPLSIREPPDRGVWGSFHWLCVDDDHYLWLITVLAETEDGLLVSAVVDIVAFGRPTLDALVRKQVS